MNPLSNKQLSLNQKFTDLCEEFYWDCYNDGDKDVNFDSKALMKFMWNKGYMLREKDYTIFE